MAAAACSGHSLTCVLVISNLEYGGAQRQVIELANMGNALGGNFHVCSLSEYVPLADELQERRERLHVIRKRFKFDISVVPRLTQLLRRLDADVVHGFLFDAELSARLAGRLAGTRVVVGSERNADYQLKRRKRLAYRLTRGYVDAVIANSSAGANFLSRMVEPSRTPYRVVHNGVNVDRFRPGHRGESRRALGLGDDPIVGMFASFKRQKNHPLFFAAARRILDRSPQTRFLLVGDELHGGMHGSDAYKIQVQALVDRLGLRPHCLFLGNRSDVERIYTACDVTVLPSLFEGTPNVVLESMACGVPVVVTAVSDNAYVVPEGRVGFLVPLGDEPALADRVLSLLADATRRREMGLAARTWVEDEFSLSRLAEKTIAVYREALNAKSSSEFGSTSVGSSEIKS